MGTYLIEIVTARTLLAVMPTMDYDACVARILQSIEQSPKIHEVNKRLIGAYHRDLLLTGIGAARRQKLTNHLKVIAEHLGNGRFDRLDRADIENLVEWFHTRGSAQSTISDYKQVLKQFYRGSMTARSQKRRSGFDEAPNPTADYSRDISSRQTMSLP